MRARIIYPFLFSGIFLLLTTLLILWSSPPTPGWASAVTWTDLQGPSGGPAQAIAINPAYPGDQTVLAGGGQDMYYASWLGQGIFRSLDGGLTWGESGGPPTGAVMDVAISPRWKDDGMAVAGLWQGVWTTHDRGASWQQVSGDDKGAPGGAWAVAVTSPAAGDYTLLAGGAYGGLYRSADEGATWSYLFDPGGVRRLAFDPEAPSVALAATGTGLWRSTDAGLQWTRVTTTTADDVAIGAGGRAYAVFDGQASRSDDGGITWQAIAGPPLPVLDTLGLSADEAGLFLAAGPHLYRFDMAADTVVTVTTDLVAGHIMRLALSPTFGEDKTLLAGTLDGVWISHDGGATFTRNEGFVPQPIRRVQAVGGLHDGDLFAAGKDGIWRRGADGWHSLNSGILGTMPSLVVDLAISPGYAQDHTLFAVQLPASGLGSAFLRSTDGGQTWESLLAGKEYMNQAVLSPDFGHDQRVYLVAVNKIWTSSTGGDAMVQDPFWDDSHQVRVLAISPTFAKDHALVAAGDKVYRSTDSGSTWQAASSAPVLSPTDGLGWRPAGLVWAESGQLYFSIYMHDTVAPYLRHDQIWTSSDKGQTWTQLTAAPDVPIESLATGPSATGSGEALYASTYDSNEADERVLAPDLYVSRDNGATWLNLGGIPGGAARLEAPVDVPDQVWAGSQGAWLLEARQAPTATPNPVHELLSNRSFEYTGVWRIPDTLYDAAYSQEQHYAGYWSMRTGITKPGDNVRSYSDFSQEVTLPLTGTVTLRLHRWAQSGSAAETGMAIAAEATTLEDFYQLLDARAGDLQYALVIEQPGNKIHYLYARLDNQQAWEEKTFDLKDYLGKTVRLQLGTYNDGSGPVAAQYFDVLELNAVDPAQPAPTATPMLEAQMWLPYVENDRGR